MNLSVILAVGALAITAPFGYVAYEALDARASPAEATAPFEAAAPTNLVLRIHHDGEPAEATLLLKTTNGKTLDERTFTLTEGDHVVEHAVDPANAYVAKLSVKTASTLPFTDLFSSRLMGTSEFDFAGCDLIEVAFQTAARVSYSGIRVLGDDCAAGVTRHMGIENSGATAKVPYPTCPLQCTMAYSLGGDERLVFDVPEGATRVEVRAHWTPESPVTEEMRIMLTTPNPECGEKCWSPVAGATGTREVSFVHDAPTPGEHSIWTSFTMPAGVSVSQAVWLEILVHSS